MTAKRILKITGLVLCAGFLIQCLFDPLLGMRKSRENAEAGRGLPLGRSKWDQQKITHYRFDAEAGAAMGCVWGANLEVQDEVVIKMGRRTDWPGPYTEPYEEPDWETSDTTSFLCDYHNFTIPGLFDYLERELSTSFLCNLVTDISFDDQYGFISGVHFGDRYGNGWLSPRISDCGSSFSIENFEVLDE